MCGTFSMRCPLLVRKYCTPAAGETKPGLLAAEDGSKETAFDAGADEAALHGTKVETDAAAAGVSGGGDSGLVVRSEHSKPWIVQEISNRGFDQERSQA